MTIDRLRCFLGKYVEFQDTKLYSPTIDDISDIGEMQYHLYLSFSLFDKENILKKIFNFSDIEYEEIESVDDFDALTDHSVLTEYLSKSISFFTKLNILFNKDSRSFQCDGKDVINKTNYISYIEHIKVVNGMKIEEEIKFKNERVKEKYKKMMAMKRKFEESKSTSLELKDILSILCSAEGNGISIFNVGSMTIYQVYASFERLNVRENHLRTLQIWANTYTLKEGEKLPEWLIKTKY